MLGFADNWRLLHKMFGWHFVWLPGIESYDGGMHTNPFVRRVVFLEGKPTFTHEGTRGIPIIADDDRFRPLTFSFDEDGNPVANKSLHL